MNLEPFIVAWTGSRMSVGIDRYALSFEPQNGYPLGLHLVSAWEIDQPPETIDPMEVPDPVIESARRYASDLINSWGSKTGMSIYDYPKPHPVLYNGMVSPGLGAEDIHRLLKTMEQDE